MVGSVKCVLETVQVSVGGMVVRNGGSFAAGPLRAGAPSPLAITISNPGTDALVLGSPPSIASEVNAGVDLAAGVAMRIEAGATEAFSLDVTPLAEGVFSFQLVVESNDPEDPIYTVTVEGSGAAAEDLPPEIEVVVRIGTGRLEIQSGDDAGTFTRGVDAVEFCVRNTGGQDLEITMATVTAIETVECFGDTGDLPMTSIASGGVACETFSSFCGVTSQLYEIDIHSNDPDEPRFTFEITELGEASVGGNAGPSDKPLFVVLLLVVLGWLGHRWRRHA